MSETTGDRPAPKLFGAIDIGASSGRVIAGFFSEGKLSLREVHRFTNGPVQRDDLLAWNFSELYAQLRHGLRELGAYAERLGQDVVSVGIDTWAVDYGLVAGGELLDEPACYREPQNELGVTEVHARVSFEELYEITGMQFLPFNSLYQIARQQARQPGLWGQAEKLLLLPDLIGYLLTGVAKTERTNASSTGLLDARTREFSEELLERLAIDPSKFPELADAGEELGRLREGFGPRMSQTRVVLVGSHDTASAVVGNPATEPNFAFLSSGTWSLLGAEIAEPILSDASRQANFSNELGVDGRVRYLKNLSGLWLLSESLRYWKERGEPQDLSQLLAEAAKVTTVAEIDAADPRFIAPGPMPELISAQLAETGQRAPQTKAELTAIILHSLAKSYARGLAQLKDLTGLTFDTLHITGGGSQNQLLCQLTANYCQLEVLAGPVEATAIGNLLVQARAAGLTGATLEDVRAVIRNSDFELASYQPSN
jgi:rhamnulokinase